MERHHERNVLDQRRDGGDVRSGVDRFIAGVRGFPGIPPAGSMLIGTASLVGFGLIVAICVVMLVLYQAGVA
jgi:hypothetical protein